MALRRESFVAILFVVFLATIGSAELTEQEKSFLGKAISLNNLKQFGEAATILEGLYRQYPQDKQIALELVRAIGYGPQYPRAVEVLNDLRKYYPHDLEIKEVYLSVLEAHQGRKEPRLYQRAHHDSIGNDEVDLMLARTLSWNHQLNEAIEVYTQIAQRYPHRMEVRRELARVLGWDQQYEQSVLVYTQLLKDFPNERTLYLEMMAKQHFYKWHHTTAISFYHQWLDLEPRSIEATFDLAETYAREKLFLQARDYYTKLTELLPKNEVSAHALERIAHILTKPSLGLGFDFKDASSGSRSTDLTYYEIFERYSVPFQDHVKFNIKQGNKVYYFSDFPTLYRNQSAIGLDYLASESLKGRLEYRHHDYTDGLDNTDHHAAELTVKPSDFFQVGLGLQREESIENSTTLRSGLYRDRYEVRWQMTPSRKLYWAGDYTFAHYSDGNSRDAIGFNINYDLWKTENRLSWLYRFEQYGFDDSHSDYFSPGSFHSNQIGLEWQQFLKAKNSWAAQDSFYTLRYQANFDVRDNRAHHLFFGFNHDFKDNLGVDLQWSKTIFEHRSIYKEDQFKIAWHYLF